MRRACLPFLLALAIPHAVRGETIYAVSIDSDWSGLHLLRFDSASPWILEREDPMSGDLVGFVDVTLEFDLTTREFYGFAFLDCQLLCPPIPIVPASIDPFTGSSSFTDWPGFPGFELFASDFDIHPLTGELRLFGREEQNFRYSLRDLELAEDEPLETKGFYSAIAHAPPSGGGAEVETFAVLDLGSLGPHLVRVGGPGGVPPASSGEVTMIGPLAAEGDIGGFDISPRGTAYLSTFAWTGGDGGGYVNRLYRVDLAAATVQEVGTIATQDQWTVVTGIAVAPEGLAPEVLEIPALSHTGMALFVLLLVSFALRWIGRSAEAATSRR